MAKLLLIITLGILALQSDFVNGQSRHRHGRGNNWPPQEYYGPPDLEVPRDPRYGWPPPGRQFPQFTPTQFPQFPPTQFPQFPPTQFPQFPPRQFPTFPPFPQFPPRQFPQFPPRQFPPYQPEYPDPYQSDKRRPPPPTEFPSFPPNQYPPPFPSQQFPTYPQGSPQPQVPPAPQPRQYDVPPPKPDHPGIKWSPQPIGSPQKYYLADISSEEKDFSGSIGDSFYTEDDRYTSWY